MHFQPHIRFNNVASFSAFATVQLRYPLFADMEPRLWLIFLRQPISFIIRGRNVHGIDITTAEDEITPLSGNVGLHYDLEERKLPLIFCLSINNACGPGSSVGIAPDYGLDGRGSNPSGDEIFRPPRPALRPTQPPVK